MCVCVRVCACVCVYECVCVYVCVSVLLLCETDFKFFVQFFNGISSFFVPF